MIFVVIPTKSTHHTRAIYCFGFQIVVSASHNISINSVSLLRAFFFIYYCFQMFTIGLDQSEIVVKRGLFAMQSFVEIPRNLQSSAIGFIRAYGSNFSRS